MKTYKFYLLLGLIAMSACKKNDSSSTSEEFENTSDTISTVDSVTTQTDSVSESNAQSSSEREYFTKKPDNRGLTQYQKDSIKTERGAIVTPPDNVGASLTPGSGRAVPRNKKTGPSSTANMGSSTGN